MHLHLCSNKPSDPLKIFVASGVRLGSKQWIKKNNPYKQPKYSICLISVETVSQKNMYTFI